jgi:hypothetical protein
MRSSSGAADREDRSDADHDRTKEKVRQQIIIYEERRGEMINIER